VVEKLGRYTHASLGYILESSKLSDLDPTLLAVGYTENESIKSSLVPAISFLIY